MNVPNGGAPLSGQTALVVSGDCGIGAVVAEAFAAAGAKVLINYLHENPAADRIAQRIRAKQGQAMIFQADVSRESQVSSMFDVLAAYWGGLNTLVTNADLALAVPAGNMDREQWREILRQNLVGQFLCVRQALREFAGRGAQAATALAPTNIICVSTFLGGPGDNAQPYYAVCKADMAGLYKAWVSAHGQENADKSGGLPTAKRFIEIWNGLPAPDSVALLSADPEQIAKTAVGLAVPAA
ncbi:SDR family NAD(P)-dependent oxidoreductase [Methylomonas sp. EFPC1]|uniref:SDR family NAD(P)-dependent oxidoreductase n=1 Tax=Methylomonas sp. EFPC1 TaxID=2812647 RepID=UPI0019689EAB|nr:SDR family NAD(P)-dependent oxidoreductase [Methylomonas sp. EFPC1]QSB02441.1 SDR family NAD(P)-dependent oxidoreductase [Methylomonas sp. EFPC1]